MRPLTCDIRQIYPDEYVCEDLGIEYNSEIKGHPSCFKVGRNDNV